MHPLHRRRLRIIKAQREAAAKAAANESILEKAKKAMSSKKPKKSDK